MYFKANSILGTYNVGENDLDRPNYLHKKAISELGGSGNY